METVTAASYAGRLNSENKIIVILTVEIWSETIKSGETVVYKMIFFFMPHRVTERRSDNVPAMLAELVDDSMTEVDRVDRIVRAESGSVIVKHDRFRLW